MVGVASTKRGDVLASSQRFLEENGTLLRLGRCAAMGATLGAAMVAALGMARAMNSASSPSFVIQRGTGRPDPRLKGAVVAIGNFDGVHRGHRAVIAAALTRARALDRPAAALTFEPHPRSFFRPQEPLFRLTDERNKLRLLAATGLDGAIVLRFDAALAALSADEFVERILLDRLRISGGTIGVDFHFGANRTGSPHFSPPISTDKRSTSPSSNGSGRS